MTRFLIEPTGDAVAATHVSPGQYVEVRANGETGYFVLASEPGARRFELVMRSGGGASDVLLRMQAGVAVEVTDAIGPGFPVERAQGRALVVVLGGTGVAAGRPLVRPRIAGGDAARTLALVGARTRAELAMEEDLDEWERAGVRVVVCLSQTNATAGAEPAVGARDEDRQRSRWRRFAEGYVQDALVVHAPTFPLRGAHVFAVGADSMVEALRQVGPALGIAPDDVHTNY